MQVQIKIMNRHDIRNLGQILLILAGLFLFFLAIAFLSGAHLAPDEREDRAARWNPEWSKAKHQREVAEELRRQNDIRERELQERKD